MRSFAVSKLFVSPKLRCGPCRSFTPMLTEMYLHLKERFSTHGVEIVFVSSDRDLSSFLNYYRSMPWTAIPFDSLRAYKENLSFAYQVRGIPSFVLLDAVTGQVVSGGSDSRREIVQACQRGEPGIDALWESWLQRVPAETNEMLDMLEQSTKDVHIATSNEESDYLKRLRVPGVAEEEDVKGGSQIEFSHIIPQPPTIDDRVVKEVATTAIAYVANARKAPWSTKFRQVKLSNKVADRIVSTPGGIRALESLGFHVVVGASDAFARIPIFSDIDNMHDQMKRLVDQ